MEPEPPIFISNMTIQYNKYIFFTEKYLQWISQRPKNNYSISHKCFSFLNDHVFFLLVFCFIINFFLKIDLFPYWHFFSFSLHCPYNFHIHQTLSNANHCLRRVCMLIKRRSWPMTGRLILVGACFRLPTF